MKAKDEAPASPRTLSDERRGGTRHSNRFALRNSERFDVSNLLLANVLIKVLYCLAPIADPCCYGDARQLPPDHLAYKMKRAINVR